MKVLNFGSLNLDYVYQVESILIPGETQASKSRQTFCGGKGLNQSIALAKAGIPVYHAGLIGEGGEQLLEVCRENGVIQSLLNRFRDYAVIRSFRSIEMVRTVSFFLEAPIEV